MKKGLALVLIVTMLLMQLGGSFAFAADGEQSLNYVCYGMYYEGGQMGLSKDYDGVPVQFPAIEDFYFMQEKDFAPIVTAYDDRIEYSDICQNAYEIVKANANWYIGIYDPSTYYTNWELIDYAPVEPGDYKVVYNDQVTGELLRSFTASMYDENDPDSYAPFYFTERTIEFTIWGDEPCEKTWIEYTGDDICELLFRTAKGGEFLSAEDFTLFRDSWQSGKTPLNVVEDGIEDYEQAEKNRIEYVLSCAIWHRLDANGEAVPFANSQYQGLEDYSEGRFLIGSGIPSDPGKYSVTLGYCEYDEFTDESTGNIIASGYPVGWGYEPRYEMVPTTLLVTISAGQAPQHTHTFDSGAYEALATRATTFTCTSCGYSYTQNPVYVEGAGSGNPMPEGTAFNPVITGSSASYPADISLTVTAFSANEKKSDIAGEFTNSMSDSTNMEPEDIDRIFDITLSNHGTEIHLGNNESVNFDLKIGIEAAHELKEGTMLLIHNKGGLIEAVDTEADPDTGIANVTSDGLSPFALVRISDTNYYGRLQLSKLPNGDALVYAYDRIAEGVEARVDPDTGVSLWTETYKVAAEDRKVVMEAYLNDYPQHFWLDNTYGYSGGAYFSAYYPHYLDELKDKDAEFEAAALDMLEAAGITETNVGSMSDYEKELRIHDALCRHIVYDSTAPNRYSAWGAIVDGRSVCEGETEAYQYLLERVGVLSHRVTGNSINPSTGKSIPHAWNINKIDGDWYYVDITWDNQCKKAEDLGKDNRIFYTYFNITTDQLAENHAISEPVYELPLCTATKYNYYVKNSEYNINTDAAPTTAQLQALGEQLKTQSFARLNITGSTAIGTWVTTNNCGRNIIGSWLGLSGMYTGAYSMKCTSLGSEYHLTFIPSSGVASSYSVSLPTGAEYTVTSDPADITSVERGGGFKFTVSIDPAYVKGTEFAVKLNGNPIYPDGGVYYVTDAACDSVITVSGLIEKEMYHVQTPSGEGYSISAYGGSKSTVDKCGSYKFVVDVDSAYVRDPAFAVKANGVLLLPDTNEVYSIIDIEENQVIAVTGVLSKSSLVQFKAVCVSALMTKNYVAEYDANGRLLCVNAQDFSSYVGMDNITVYYQPVNTGAKCKLFSMGSSWQLLGVKTAESID